MEYMLVLANIKETRNVSTVKLPNNENMNATKTGILPPSRSLGTHAKKAHILDVLHGALIIFLCQLCDNECIAILDQN